MAAAGCPDDGGLAGGEGRLRVPASLDFGRVFLGEVRTETFEVTSDGTLPVRFRISFGPGRGEGLQVGPASGELPPGSMTEGQVQFEPTEVGSRDVAVIFTTETGTASIRILADVQPPPDCEDGNICTRNRFDLESGRCVTEISTEACDDFDACTEQDTCAQAGGQVLCLGRSLNCDDGNICTDDFCDRRTGCVHELNRDCDDGNPCTQDFCEPTIGCAHTNLPDNTPCAETVACTSANVCRDGRCLLFNVPDGVECDDQDPCSSGERCASGECLDPDYPYPVDGELKWTTQVGPLSEGAGRSPVADVNGELLLPTRSGIVALDSCGAELWRNPELTAAVGDQLMILPAGLLVPQPPELLLLDRTSGQILDRLDLRDLHTVETATVDRVRILSLAARSSGAVVGSMWLDREEGTDEGFLFEVGRDLSTATVFAALGAQHAPHVALDLDESVLVVLAEGGPDGTGAGEALVRFGIPGVPRGRWALDFFELDATEIAIDAAGRVWWTAGLFAVSATGEPRVRLPPDADFARRSGGVVIDRDRAYVVDPGQAGEADARLVAWTITSTVPDLVVELGGPADGSTPAVDQAGNLFVALNDGRLLSFDRSGLPRYALDLETQFVAPSLTLAPGENLVVLDGERVFAVQSDRGLAPTAWPRYRRDNFGTAHR